ncbi:hypothetical protein TKK_0007186 [Trichogramma kaykai]
MEICNMKRDPVSQFRTPAGIESIHQICDRVYPDQPNPLTVTAVVKYWLGGPDPLDYVSMFENPGCPELGVPPHWHYVSLGLTDLHGDNRVHKRSNPPRASGFGFELTFRLLREPGQHTPPPWPAQMMQELSKYIFSSGNILYPGDHVAQHSPLDSTAGIHAGPGKINEILVAEDPQLRTFNSPHGTVSFLQIVGITAQELQAAQHWNGLGVLELLKSSQICGPWLITNPRRVKSIMEEDSTVAEKIRMGIEREGSDLCAVTAKCWWERMHKDVDKEKYRDTLKQDSDDEDESNLRSVSQMSAEDPELQSESENVPIVKLDGVHLTFNREAGSILPLAIKGRIMHGRHFTFKSFITNAAITFVASTVSGAIATTENPYVFQSPWLQILLSDELAETMAQELQILDGSQQLQLPKTFSWPERRLKITIVE